MSKIYGKWKTSEGTNLPPSPCTREGKRSSSSDKQDIRWVKFGVRGSTEFCSNLETLLLRDQPCQRKQSPTLLIEHRRLLKSCCYRPLCKLWDSGWILAWSSSHPASREPTPALQLSSLPRCLSSSQPESFPDFSNVPSFQCTSHKITNAISDVTPSWDLPGPLLPQSRGTATPLLCFSGTSLMVFLARFTINSPRQRSCLHTV